MTFWRKGLASDAEPSRADVILQKKKRKQSGSTKGLGAVAIARSGVRAVHQRNEDRFVLRGISAETQVSGKDVTVELLNLSSNGVMIATDHAFDIGEEVRLTLDECSVVTTAVRWVRNRRVGLEFLQETVILADAGVQEYVLRTIRREAAASGHSGHLAIGKEQRIPSPRHNLVFVAKLCWADCETTARLRNISANGAMIALANDTDLERGDEVTLSLVRAGDVAARVQWVKDRQCGLEFDAPFDVSLLLHESAAELAPEPKDDICGNSDADGSAPGDFDALRLRLGNVRNPHCPPQMRYGKLTLDEVYATLYPEKAEASGEA